MGVVARRWTLRHEARPYGGPAEQGPGEVGGTPGVGVKSCNPQRTTSGEGVQLERIRRSGTKPRGANGIRYPGSHGCKRCRLGVGGPTRAPGAGAKVLSLLLGEYGRKTET